MRERLRKVVVEIVKKALDGEELPKFVQVGVEDVPKLEEIPLIKKASVNGIVEVTRGCPRRCKFCSITLRPLRHYTLEMIEKEMLVK